MAIETHDMAFSAHKRELPAYLARPAGRGPFPGVVVIHEAYGLNDNVKDIARRLANEGYAALAVDLFAGQNRAVCMARFMMAGLRGAQEHDGIRDLKAALTWLGAQAEVDEGRLGAIGFCLGGGFAITWAATDDRLKVIAPFYGMNPRPIEEAALRLCPVVGSYPEKDFTARAGRKLKEVLDTTGIPHDIKIYPGAKHSFFNDQRPGSYNAEAAADAWQRVLEYFQTYLAR